MLVRANLEEGLFFSFILSRRNPNHTRGTMQPQAEGPGQDASPDMGGVVDIQQLRLNLRSLEFR